MTTRADLRTQIRQELQDNVTPYFWSDAAMHTALAAAFSAYSQYAPASTQSAIAVSAGSQGQFSLPANTLAVVAVLINGVTVAPVPDLATLNEPAAPVWQTSYVQPVIPYAALSSHGQAWTVWNGAVQLRYPVPAPATVQLILASAHLLPADDLTAVTVPDTDTEVIVLHVCDRLAASARTDAARRGAPNATAAFDPGYAARYRAAVRARRRATSRNLAASP